MKPGDGVGQRAAARDIARARARARSALVEGDDDDDDIDQEMIAAATTVFQKLEAVIGASRTYAADHPARERFMDGLIEKLRAYHARHDDLVFNLEVRGLNVDGVAVYTAKRVDTNIWFPLFSEGVRCIEIASGIRADELTILTNLVQEMRDPKREDDDEEDDAVTMLWEADFDHLTFMSVDDTVEGGESFDSKRADALQQMIEVSTVKHRGGAENAASTRARRSSKVALRAADFNLLRAENLTTLDELPEATAYENVMRLDLDQQHRFGAGCADEQSIVERYVVALLQSLAALANTGQEAPVLDQLRELFMAVTADRRWLRARLMVEQLILASSDERGGAHEWRSRVEQHVVTEATLGDMLAELGRLEATESSEIIWLTARLSSWAAPAVVAAIAQTQDEALRDSLMAIAVSWGQATQAALVDVIPRAGEDVALELVRLALHVGGVGVEASVRAALSHSASSVRTNGLRAVLSFGVEELSDGAAAEAVTDDDPMLRQLATAYITRYGITRARPALQRLLESERAASFQPGERAQLYIALAAAGGSPTWFMEKLGQRNLLGLASGDSDRVAAAAALGHLRHQAARPMLEKLAHARLGRGQLKDVCSSALEDLQLPPPIVEDRPRPRRMTPPGAHLPHQNLAVRRAQRPSGTRPPPIATGSPNVRPPPRATNLQPSRPPPTQPPQARSTPSATQPPTRQPPSATQPPRSRSVPPPKLAPIQWKPAGSSAPTSAPQPSPPRPEPQSQQPERLVRKPPASDRESRQSELDALLASFINDDDEDGSQ